jgi:hypothetical protein
MAEGSAPVVIPVRASGLSTFLTTLWSNQWALVLPIMTAFLFLLAWQAISVYGNISPTILPPPTMVLDQITDNFPLIMKHTIPTTYETLLAFGISIPLGIALAALMVYSTLAYQALYPNIVFLPADSEDRPGAALHRLVGHRLPVARHLLDFHLFLPDPRGHRGGIAISRDEHVAAVPVAAHV